MIQILTSFVFVGFMCLYDVSQAMTLMETKIQSAHCNTLQQTTLHLVSRVCIALSRMYTAIFFHIHTCGTRRISFQLHICRTLWIHVSVLRLFSDRLLTFSIYRPLFHIHTCGILKDFFSYTHVWDSQDSCVCIIACVSLRI